MLNEKIIGDWKAKVKGIFSEAKKLSEEELASPSLDLGGGEEDPASTAPVDDATPEGPEGVPGEGEEEETPTITLTADCLLALLEYCAAPAESTDGDDLDIDGGEEEGTGESIEGSQPDASMVAGGGLGVGMEGEEIPPAVDATQPGEGSGDGADDVIAADDTIGDVDAPEDTEKTPEQIVQSLIDLSADKEGEPIDVDSLSLIFSASEGGDDLGGDDLSTNTELPGQGSKEPNLPATTGAETLAEDTSNSSGGELERKHRALASLEARLKSASGEDASDIRDDIAAVKSQIAKLKTKHITSAQGHKHGEAAKAGHKDDKDA